MSYKSKYINSSVVRAMSIIRALQSSSRPLGTADVAQAAHVSRDQAYRILITLEGEGVIDCTRSRLWVLVDGTFIPRGRKHAKVA